MKFWPELFLNCDKIKNSSNFAIVVLNRPIHAEKEVVECLWNQASIRITVDGGTNRWLSWLRKHKLENELRLPDFISGDLDSVYEESIKFFSQSRVVKTIDQDETDFTKSLRVLEPFISELKLENIVALCETSGRIDQILANINTLFINLKKPQEISRPVFILSANSLSWLLSAGDHQINIPEKFRKFWCSLVPLGGVTTVTTSGLRWNLTNYEMNFGGIVSTSNKYDGVSDVVRILTDKPLLWSMGISKLDDD